MNENRHDKVPSHNIDDLFRSAIEPLREAPSAAVWENVEKDLDRYNIISIKRKYNNFKKIAIALVLVLSSALIYEFQTQPRAYHNGTAGNKNINDTLSGSSLVENKNVTKKDVSASEKPGLQLPSNNQQTTVTAEQVVIPSIEKQDFEKPLQQGYKTTGKKMEDKLFRRSYISGVQEDKFSSKKNPELTNSYVPVNLKSASEGYAFSRFPSAIDLLKFENGVTRQHNVALAISNYNHSPVENIAGINGLADFAKRSVKPSKKHSSVSLSLIFSPDFTSRLVKADWPVNREDNRDEIRKSERYGFSYSLGALVDYKLNKHWLVQSGFTLSRAVINIDPKFIFARPDDLGDMKYKFNSSSGYSYLSPHTISRPAFGDSLHAFGSTSSLLYVSIPVNVKYKITRKKIDYYASTGIAANVLIKDKIETSLVKGGSYEDAVNRDIRGLKPIYYSALLSAGASYNFNNTLAVSFSPTARLALTSINKDAPVKSYQQSLGLVAGVQVSF